MSVGFTKQQWSKIKSDSNLWWEGELNRPLLHIRLRDSSKKIDGHSFQSFYPITESVNQVINDWESQLSSVLHLGDAFPMVFPNFGPGSIAAYMGAELINGQETVWFHDIKSAELKDLKLHYDPNEKWFVRTKNLVKTAIERWEGSVLIGFTDLGGNLDILSTFRPSEKLLFDLYDFPDDVKRLTWRAHELWWKYFEEFELIGKDVNPGYSSWAGIFSEQPHYMLQCDFCYMISPDMFDEFVKPELEASSDKLLNAFYHLDGPGALPHLDSLLEIESLKGVQWVPGAGSKSNSQWPEVFRKITDAGKKIQIFSCYSEEGFDETLDIIVNQIGRSDNIIYTIDADISQRYKAERLIGKYL